VGINRAEFDIDYSNIKKDESPAVAAIARAHIGETYCGYFLVVTDGSVVDCGNAGSAFVVPALKMEKSYHLGKDFSTFTAELIAILMALNLF